jgi:hypothetical protein
LINSNFGDYLEENNDTTNRQLSDNDLKLGRYLAWLLLINQKNVSNLALLNKYVEIIFTIKASKEDSHKLYSPYQNFSADLDNSEQKKQIKLMTFFISYAKGDLYWFMSTFYEINPTAACKYVRLPLFAVWKYVLAEFYQKHKELIRGNSENKLVEFHRLYKKELKPLIKLLEIPDLSVLENSNISRSDMFQISLDIGYKEEALEIFKNVGLLEKKGICIDEAVMQLKGIMLNYSINKINTQRADEKFDMEKWRKLKPLPQVFRSLFGLKDFFMQYYKYFTAQMHPSSDTWIPLNTMIILGEHYYSQTYVKGSLSRNTNNIKEEQLLSTKSNLHQEAIEKVYDHALNIQNIVRDTVIAEMKNPTQMLLAITNIILISLEDFSQELKDNKKANEVLRFLTDLLSAISSYDFTACLSTQCQEEDDSTCKHCSDDVVEHVAIHLKKQIQNVIDEEKVSTILLSTESKVDLLKKILPQLIGTINNESLFDAEEKFKERYKKDVGLFSDTVLENSAIEVPNFLKAMFKTFKRFREACDQNTPEARENLINVTFQEISRFEKNYKVRGNSKGVVLNKLTMAYYKLYNDNMDGMVDAIEYSTKSKEQAQNIAQFVIESAKLVDLGALKQMASSIPKFQDSADFEFVREFFAKTKDKHSAPKDVLKLLDRAGDGNGTVSVEEFGILAKRLGTPLSEHRIREVFTNIKAGTIINDATESLDLNADEFADATQYLKKKQIYHAQRLIGITPEVLYPMLVYLLFLLLLIFSFIFVGIKAFALGGAFGAVINSILPAVAALGVGGSDDTKDKLNDDNIKRACNLSKNIVQSEDKESI